MQKFRIDSDDTFTSYIQLPKGERVEVGANTVNYIMTESQLISLMRGNATAKWLATQLANSYSLDVRRDER